MNAESQAENAMDVTKKEALILLRDEKNTAAKRSSKEQRREYFEREIEKRILHTNPLGKDRDYNRYWWFTELTELSLAPTRAAVLEKSRNSSSSSSESKNTPSRKRKLFSDPFQVLGYGAVPIQATVNLHARSPLPLDWEQCLDLESGIMYYLNRKTLKKSCSWPKKQKLDLELTLSTVPNCPDQWNSSRSSPEESENKNHASRNSNMVARACSNCHFLVILSKSSPSCPNCKYLHSFPALRSPQKKASPARSLSTLRLLN